MRGTRRVLSRSNSRALTLLFFLFFLEKPRGRIKPSLKKKDRQRSRKDRRFSSSSSSFFRRRKMRRRGGEGAKRSWHYERSFGRKNDPLGGVILIMRVDRRLCGRALFSFSPCLRADKRVSIVRLRVRLFLPFACETTGRRGWSINWFLLYKKARRTCVYIYVFHILHVVILLYFFA